ncbi:MAG: hypothetical protein AAGU76_11800 [Sedimentibacter sp.]|uniref:hypothetical protein n=1 Tax=Sedimentibacter sp. TaxID=1960295 RepID=UPI0031584E29
MFKFKLNNTAKIHSGSLIYCKDENSFDFVPSNNADILLLVGYLHIGVDSETMTVQQVWGFQPYEGWIKKTLSIPDFIEGELMVEGDILPGMSYRVNGGENWTAQFDSQTGWVCIGESEKVNRASFIKFADNTIAVINEGKLIALWLKPKIE